MKNLTLGKKILYGFLIFFIISVIITAINGPEQKNTNNKLINNDIKKIQPINNKNEKNKNDLLKDFLSKELNKDIDLKNQVKLFIVKEIKNPNGSIDKLKDDFPINIFKTVEADLTQLEARLKPGIEVELLDYKYDKEKLFDQSLSRCKIKPKDNNKYKTKGGWLNCGWIEAKIIKKSN